MIKKTATGIIVYTIVISLGAFFTYGAEHSLSVLSGGMLMLVNLAGLSFIWSRIFSKKSIALAVLAIIFKYLILGTVLWALMTAQWLRPIAFLFGMASLIFSALFSALKKN